MFSAAALAASSTGTGSNNTAAQCQFQLCISDMIRDIQWIIHGFGTCRADLNCLSEPVAGGPTEDLLDATEPVTSRRLCEAPECVGRAFFANTGSANVSGGPKTALEVIILNHNLQI